MFIKIGRGTCCESNVRALKPDPSRFFMNGISFCPVDNLNRNFLVFEAVYYGDAVANFNVRRICRLRNSVSNFLEDVLNIFAGVTWYLFSF